MALAQAILRGPSPLSSGHRELIAAFVSRGNDCRFCESTHGACAAVELGEADLDALVSRSDTKLAALLHLADRVRIGGTAVRGEDMDRAKAAGASDVEIHDAVLVAAAFCMYNRYVDGLAAWTPSDPDTYRAIASLLVEYGYESVVPPQGQNAP
jgi:uncharacterized peroxidase-related enzyme